MFSSTGWAVTLAVGQHAVRAEESILVPTWTGPPEGESIPVQKWNSPQGELVHYTDAAAGASTESGRSSALVYF